MNINIVYTKKKSMIHTIIFLKDDTEQNLDGTIAVIYQGQNTEKIYLPSTSNTQIDPIYPSTTDNYVNRIEKGIYLAHGYPPPNVKKIKIWAKAEHTTISKEIEIPPSRFKY